MSTKGNPTGRPVHCELPVEDQARAADLSAKVFGWSIRQWEGAPYWPAGTGPDSESGRGSRMGLFEDDESAVME